MGKMEQVWGEHESGTLGQYRHILEGAEGAVLLADGHPGFVMPIGCVAMYDNKVSVTGVGPDIGCGTRAVKTNLRGSDFSSKKREKLADKLAKRIRFGLGGGEYNLELWDDKRWGLIEAPKARDWLRGKAQEQLGSCGAGNHYVDVLVDDEDAIWVAVHFGSRGLGHTIHNGATSVAQGKKWEETARPLETVLDTQSELGVRYWGLMELALDYAALGRGLVVDEVVDTLRGDKIGEAYDVSHNLARREVVGGKEVVLVRKGATPLGEGAFVGGSMGEAGAIVRARSGVNIDNVLNSTVHGSGRVMSRRVAAGGKHMAGQVTRRMMNGWLRENQVVLRGGDVDESPHVYRRLDSVLAVHDETVEVLHRLRPIIVLMAGGETMDPYKD